MKSTPFISIAVLVSAFLLAQPTVSSAITFTGDTLIAVDNTTYDGMDIVVSNCVLTVDGPHSFASVQVLKGGVITHTFAANGSLPAPVYHVTGEVHLLSSNSLSTLNFSNVSPATVVVRDPSASVIYTNGIDYEILSLANGFVALQLLPGSSIAEGSTNSVDYQYSGPVVPSGLTLTVSNNLLIELEGSINADGKGFAGGQGPGQGRVAGSPPSGGGAGHGGNGGKGIGLDGSGMVYDSIQEPAALGSGGGAGYNGLGGPGGGAVRLWVGGALLLDGRISANGLGSVTSRSGGGSGGSIWLTAQTVSGSGAMSADGGDGELPGGGGGGGGRISIVSEINVFTGTMTAFGGNGYTYGGAGTIYTSTGTQTLPGVLVDNGGHQGLTTLSRGLDQSSVVAQSGAVVSIPGSQSLAGLTIRSNASLIISNTASATLSVSGNATIEAGGSITADGMGLPANQGRGAGRTFQALVPVGGGGGYGGNGGSASAGSAWGGVGYGNYTAPADLGSGGASALGTGLGSAGGGAIHLSVTGTLIVNGTVSANGMVGMADGSGGGSGGSIWISAGKLAGAGVIAANGGDGNGTGLYAGGGGGGGRISLQGTSYFLGSISAQGGNGNTRGGAGTVYFAATQGFPRLVIDNGGSAGTNTVLSTFTSATADVTVSGSAVVTVQGQPYLHNVLIGSNSWVVASNLVLSASGDVVVEDGGGIVANGTGYGGSQGPGAGRYTTTLGGYVGGGGGYGGFGGTGAGTTGVAAGGMTYGSVLNPVDRGSGGGANSLISTGSAGGGAIHLTVSGILKLAGVISANGNDGLQGGGGGSGGSVWVIAGIVSGDGTITANGGNGTGSGGGGGGGRIAIEYGTNFFSGNVVARGGDGLNPGGAGTFYSKANDSSVGQLVVDNGGQPGTSTTWLSAGVIDLTVAGGAIVAQTARTSQTFSNLVIGPNSTLVLSNQQELNVLGDVTIQSGGALTADGNGYGPGQGPGAGRSGDSQQGIMAGGAGYGGNGASGASTIASGGITYGLLTSPTGSGSGGGGMLQSRPGGAGGGGIQMVISGTLTVLGRLSADGNASPQGGGGSGGSIYIRTKTLAGSGLISANGGMGGTLSGGGGGGRVALILSQANVFNGTITAFGGGGYARGGAGTIFISAESTQKSNSTVVVDNGGQLGTNTSWLSGSGTVDLVIRGGGVASPPVQQTFNSISIETNSWLRLSNQTISVIGDVRVDAGGGIVADGTGFANGQGAGAARYSSVPGYGYLGGGGGYGGLGGNASTVTSVAPGGIAYGSFATPFDRGSSGGAYPLSYGGAGAGAIRLIVSGTLELNGILSARGWPGVVPGAGGGSGGSIWLTVGALTGSGLMTANGGSGNGFGGGGGGGRIALEYALNSFTGPVTAFGGSGSTPGGAGTIYLKLKNQPVGQVILDNGGQIGSHTPLGLQFSPYDLAIKAGALADVTNSSLLLSNLNIGSGSSLTVSPSLKTLSVTVLRDAVIEPGGAITLDGRGYAAMTGPGSGTTTNAVGSGGGYGGSGGASSFQPGGGAYGSALQPIDPGSSGGFGYGIWTNGGEGGGALRLSVGRALTLNGSISAIGNAGAQDNAGGGSGGSLWLSANVLSGTGEVLATGGEGELFLGGGGGGGRIALYSPANLFNGLVSAAGGDGFTRGQDGTIYYASTLPSLVVIGQTPSNVVSRAVSSVDLTFNTAIDPYTLTGSNITLTTPNGPLSSDQLLVTSTSSGGVRLSFPPQTAEGDYVLTLGSQLQSLNGQPLSPAYTGGFAISWPVIQGRVTDEQNQPIAGVLLQPDGGLSPAQTDATGAYSLKVMPGGTVTVVPSLTNLVFVPGVQRYANVTAPLVGQNYLGVTSLAPTITVRSLSSGAAMSWRMIPGVTYQAYRSTNLVDWMPYGAPIFGSAGVTDLALPAQDADQMFFRIRASN